MEAATTTGTTRATPSLGVARRRWGEEAIRATLFAAALISVLTTTAIVISLLRETLVFFEDVPVSDYLFGTDWSPSFQPASFGVLPLVVGTLLCTAIAMSVAVPLGLGAAIYLSEYASPRVRKLVKPVLELLAGVPTIVFGFFALVWFTPNVVQKVFDDAGIFNVWSAAIIMGFMVVPTVASISEDAMSSVPQALREGAFGLGASRMQVSLRVVFPAALSGIVASIVLGVSRAIGETMIVLVAAGLVATMSADPSEAHYTFTSFIAAIAKGDIATGSVQYKTVFALGMTLFLITLVVNLISIRFVRRYRQVYE
jgi:phosphate transport system permease protein